jgi:hypothetical protein
MKKYIILFLNFLIFLLSYSCDNQSVKCTDPGLDLLVEESYAYYFKSINSRYYEAEYTTGIYKFKELAEKSVLNKVYKQEFMQLAIHFLENYSDFDLESENLLRNITDNGNCNIKMVEYIVINTMIRWFQQLFFEMDYFEIIISPEKPVIEQFKSFDSDIYLAFNSHYNRLALVVDGDTSVAGRGAGLLYSYPTTQKGVFSKNAEILITHRGSVVTFPFVINFEVK